MIDKWIIILDLELNLVIAHLRVNANKHRSYVDEQVGHLFNCKLFTAEFKDEHDTIVHEVHSLSQHAAILFSFSKTWRFANSHSLQKEHEEESSTNRFTGVFEFCLLLIFVHVCGACDQCPQCLCDIYSI